MLQRELFGIVVRRLDLDNARAFQGALGGYGFETELVADDALLALPASFGATGLRLEPDAIAVADVYGRERIVPARACVFAAAGRVARLHETRKATEEMVVGGSRYGARIAGRPGLRSAWTDDDDQYRIELFFTADPLRVECAIGNDRVARLNGVAVRLRDRDALESFLGLLRSRLPPGRVNRGLERAGGAGEPHYPNLRSFEEEIVWHFHRLRSLPAAGADNAKPAPS